MTVTVQGAQGGDMAVQGEQPYDCAACGITGPERAAKGDRMNYIYCCPNHPNESFWLNLCADCHYKKRETK
jgi:hypothetical protein